MSAAGDDDLATLFPAPVRVTIRPKGAAPRAVEIGELELGELAAVLAALKAFGGPKGLASLDPVVILVEKPQDAYKLISLVTRVELDVVVGLPISDAAALLLGAVEANQPFFVRHGRALLELVARMLVLPGPSSSPDSSSAATPSPPSAATP